MTNTIYTLEDSLGFLINRAGKSMGQRLRQHFGEKGMDMPIEHWAILVNLWIKDGLNQQELADRTFKDKTTIARAINLLEKMNVVVRVQDENDKRQKNIHLTHKGKSLKEELGPLALQTIQESVEGISEEEVEICKNVLRKIYANIKK